MSEVYKFAIRLSPQHDPALSLARRQLGLPDLCMWRDVYIEVPQPLTSEQLQRLHAALGNGFTEVVEPASPLHEGQQVQVAYKRGIVDNENDSIVDLCRLLEIPATAGRVATTYDSADPRLRELVEAAFCNPNIEEVHSSEPQYSTLQPSGQFESMQTLDLRDLNDQQLLDIGQADGRNLNLRQMRQIQKIQMETDAAAISDVLLEAMDARWSDHCSHTTWKSLGNLLKKLIVAAERTGNSNIVSMFHDNAGVWDFYDDWCIAFKAETHNGPSAVSAYFGQLTKLGGVLRDILGTGLGANPIGVFEYTATGVFGTASPLAARPSPQRIAVETIRAIKEYGNTFGVPMMQSHMTQHAGYRAKPFALGGCIGLLPKQHAQRGTPQPGDMLMLIGGLTGNDGIHGATASSAGNEMDTASVQIGSPLEEVKFRQAIVELRDADCLRALTDLGAAGLNSAVGEIGEACGVWLNTALVPLKTKGLAMWRILLSESQERMLLAVIPAKLEIARKILQRHRVRNTVVGRFTQTDRYTVVHDTSFSEDALTTVDIAQLPMSGEVGLDVPYALLEDEPEPRTPQSHQRVKRKTEWPPLTCDGLPQLLTKLLSDGELSDQTCAGFQYDSTVQGHAYYGPYTEARDACRSANAQQENGSAEALPRQACTYPIPTSYSALRPLYGKPYATVFSAAFNPWLFDAHPRLAARQMFLQALTTQVLAGVKLEDICLCDNFYTPHLEPDADYWLVEMVEELAALVEVFGTPMISGKDSSAGSVETPEGLISVPPAVYISALGKVPNAEKLLPNEWQSPGNVLVRIGPRCESAAGTVAGRVLEIQANDVDEISTTSHIAFLQTLGQLPHGKLRSGVPIGSGGLLASLFQSAMASGYGVEIAGQLDACELIKEHRCAAVVEVAEPELELLEPLQPSIVGRIVDQQASIKIGNENILTQESVKAWCNSYRDSLH